MMTTMLKLKTLTLTAGTRRVFAPTVGVFSPFFNHMMMTMTTTMMMMMNDDYNDDNE
jgi:lauroyl/myristoyl acyltransferase